MKLQDILGRRTEGQIAPVDARLSDPCELLYAPEVIDLLKARTSSHRFNCMLLAGDEMELANNTIAKVDADPCYQPSMTVLQAIRAINAKLALCDAPEP